MHSRYFGFELCPVSAASDLAVMEFGSPGRLRLDAVQTQHVLRAPRSPGNKPMAASTLIQQVGKLLRQAGEEKSNILVLI